ncbi:MAG: hypothetical protein U0N15_02900 [Bifidobacterium choerinum]
MMTQPNEWEPWISHSGDLSYLAADNSVLDLSSKEERSRTDISNGVISLEEAFRQGPITSADAQDEPVESPQESTAAPGLTQSQIDFVQHQLIDTKVRENRHWFYFSDEKHNADLRDKYVLGYGPWVNSPKLHLYTQNIAGLIRNNDSTFQMSISSRFSRDENGRPVHIGKDWFFNYMMERVLHFNLLNLDFDANPKSAWTMLLRLMFPSFLKNAVSKGIFRQYVRRYYNDPRPRGRIDVARHIRKNTPFLGSVAYSTREFDADNPVTELIRHTIEFLDSQDSDTRRILHQDQKTRKAVEQIRQATPHYESDERRKIISENIRKPVLHPFYQDYRTLQRLCIEILTNRGVEFTESSSEYTPNGILFNCSWMWESYLNVLLHDHLPQIIAVEHPDNASSEHGYHTYVGEGGKKTMYPDFLLDYRNGTDNIVVADAKYKMSDTPERDDRLQLLAYMLRFDANLAFQLNPISDLKVAEAYSDRQLDVLTGCDLLHGGSAKRPEDAPKRVAVYRLNVGQAGIESYDDYRERMQTREQQYVEAMVREIERVSSPDSAR